MHQAAGSVVLCDDTGHFRVVFESPDIVYKVCACLNSDISNASFVSVNGDRHVEMLAECLDDWNDTGSFFLCTDRCMARTGRLAADIQNIRTVSDHGFCVLEGVIHGVPFAAV